MAVLSAVTESGFGRVAVLDVCLLGHSFFVDDSWAVKTLDKWIEGVSRVTDSYGDLDSETNIDDLREHEHQVREIVSAITGKSSPPLITQIGFATDLKRGVATVKYVRGLILTRAETREHLGSNAPTMSADGLHEIVWGAAERLWSDGHHGQAVQRAATFLNAHVQDLVGRTDISDADLMAQAFSSEAPAPGKPRLRWPGDDRDLTVRAMRSGILNFSQGCFKAIRNPLAHGTDDLPMQIALEQLATLSTLARWIDGCEIVDSD